MLARAAGVDPPRAAGGAQGAGEVQEVPPVLEVERGAKESGARQYQGGERAGGGADRDHGRGGDGWIHGAGGDQQTDGEPGQGERGAGERDRQRPRGGRPVPSRDPGGDLGVPLAQERGHGAGPDLGRRPSFGLCRHSR
ncbi:hypothetical protein ACH4SK_17045 [Streptomyces inhibens]|uniref:hypothetical protein n=1 Tax=Streptomyces inhibens TaxID=2293571 RepID=UPI00378AA87D